MLRCLLIAITFSFLSLLDLNDLWQVECFVEGLGGKVVNMLGCQFAVVVLSSDEDDVIHASEGRSRLGNDLDILCIPS